MRLSTKCRGKDDLLLALEVDPQAVPEADIQWLVSGLEDYFAPGVEVAPGQTMQCGWMLTSFRKRRDGTLGLFEPDFKSFPLKWVDSTTKTLHHLRTQRDVADSLGLTESVDFAPLQHSGIMGADLRRGEKQVIMERAEGDGNDSGWFVGRADTRRDYNDPVNLSRESLYAIALKVPQSIMFLALPPGSLVVDSPPALEISYRGRTVSPRRGSFLHDFLRGRSKGRDSDRSR